MSRDDKMMRRALRVARRGWGRVHPNPLVGALVVADDQVVGVGWHAEYGADHAEVMALAAAGERARGATLYVTLEPCAHEGKTPPCTDAIRAAGIARVVFAAPDPSSKAGGGAALLSEAGLSVERGVGEAEARRLNAAFYCLHELGRTHVVCKLALSLDARLGEEAGRATRVTGEASHAYTHRLRAGYDAVMVGIETAIVDDPLLAARGRLQPRVPPARIVVDTEARLPVAGRLARRCGPGEVWVVCATDADASRGERLHALGVRIVRSARGPGGIAIGPMLDALWRHGVTSVFCEGGGRLTSSLLAADAVDRMHLMFAPRLFGERGPPAFPVPAAQDGESTDDRLSDPSRWRPVRTRRLGRDVMLVLDRERVH